jgi:NADPH:quinone reductase-like Zn-dependent oxidoreductase
MSLFNSSSQEMTEIHSELGRELGNGSLRPIVGKILPLADAPQAHREVIEGKHSGKIVLIP